MNYKFKCLETFAEINITQRLINDKIKDGFAFPFRVRIRTKVTWPLVDCLEPILNMTQSTVFYGAKRRNKHS
jgi:hypothetical protein